MPLITSMRQPWWRRLTPLAWGLAAAVCLLLALIWALFQAQLTLVGFLDSQSVWSKAQTQAVIDLEQYAAFGNPEELAAYRYDYAMLAADRRAREAVIGGHYDSARVRRVFMRGNLVSASAGGMIFMLAHFSNAPYLSGVIAAWRSMDRSLDKLDAIAAELQRAYTSRKPDPAEIFRLRREIMAIHAGIEPHSNLVSSLMASGAVWLSHVRTAAVLLVLSLVAVPGLWMARRVSKRLRDSDERYRLLFESASEAIVLVEEASGLIVKTNRLVSAWTGRHADDLLGARFDELFVPGSTHGAVDARLAMLDCRGGAAKTVEMQSNPTLWGKRVVRQVIMRDISERVALERDRRVASEALASITEGVVIVDAERRVVSVNAAHTQITGYTERMMEGMRFEELCCMPGDMPLPASIWSGIAGGTHWSGEVQVRRADGSSHSEHLSITAVRDMARQGLYYVAVFSSIHALKAQRHRLEDMANHDALTGLLNRSELERRCESAITAAARARSVVAVLFVGLDAFKVVNDSYSHAVGDRLLQTVAERIQRQLGPADAAGRIGGDEFIVLLGSLELREDAGTVAERLLACLSEPLAVDDCNLVIGASIGIASYPLDGADAPTLIANADAAMYVVKNTERNTFRFYTPIMQADTRQRLLLVSELRRALAGDELKLHFQPSIEMSSGRIVGVEALLRWQHPKRGELPPAEFIPAAESLGLIRRIDEWVLKSACAQLRKWDRAGMPPIRIAVNVSASWFGHAGFVAYLDRTLQAHAVAPGRLALEITEGTMLRLGDDTERTMRALHRLGVEVAIDDFGTGYSSMAYLKLPSVTRLKIDRSFITGLPHEANDEAIVEAIMVMARSLGLAVTAEGIETEAQHAFLLRMGCDEGQGYFYAAALPPAVIERMLITRPWQHTPTPLSLVPPQRR